MRMLLRDTLLRTLLCEDMLLRDTVLRTLLREDVAARYGAADAAVRGCCCAITIVSGALITFTYKIDRL